MSSMLLICAEHCQSLVDLVCRPAILLCPIDSQAASSGLRHQNCGDSPNRATKPVLNGHSTSFSCGRANGV